MTERNRSTNPKSASKRSDEIRRRRAENSQAGQTPLKPARPPSRPERVSQSPLGRHEDQIQGLTPRARARLSGARPAATAARRPSAQSSAPAGLPPVMARGASSKAKNSASSQGSSGKSSTRTNRRRYDVALGGQGVEMRLPSLPEVHIGWRLLSFAFVALLGFVLYFVWTSPFYQVSEIRVGGLERLTQRDVNAVLEASGQPIFAVDGDTLSSQLADAFPEFSAITVTIELPNTVLVTVTERVPVLIWRQEGRTELVDAEGIAFPPRESGVPEGLPVVDALVPPPGLTMVVQPTEEKNELEALLAEVKLNSPAAQGNVTEEAEELRSSPGTSPAAARQFLSPEMVEGVIAAAKEVPGGGPLTYTPGHGFQWQDPRGWDVYLGGVTDLQMKLQVYHTLIDRLQSEGSQPAAVSVEWVHNPYYRLER